MIGLYIHIPFCKHICTYCDFPKRIPKSDEQVEKYINRLIKEIDSYKDYLLNDEITIYIGGGTPNFLSDALLAKLLFAINSYKFRVLEYTIELNPELITESQVLILKKYGINRVSIGVQSFSFYSLMILGRHHTHQIIEEAVAILRANGLENINFDLIYGFFNQSLAEFELDLAIANYLNPTHISAYSFILEEKTVLFHDFKQNKYPKIDDDLVADMQKYARDFLTMVGYQHYEISNFAKNGYKSLHNMLYWQNEHYVGVGAGASGYIGDIRYKNNDNISKYMLNPIEIEEKIDLNRKKSEEMMLGLRMIDGISIENYEKKFSSKPDLDFNLKKHYNNGLLQSKNGRIFLTDKGIDLANIVFSEFVGD